MRANGSNGSYVIDDREKGVFLLDRAVHVSDDILREEMAEDLRQVLDLRRTRLGAEEERRLSTRAWSRAVQSSSRSRSERARCAATSTPAGIAAPSSAPTGKGNARRFMCVYHGWIYNNDGALARVPDEEAYTEQFNKDDARAASHPAQFDNYQATSGSCASTRTRRR